MMRRPSWRALVNASAVDAETVYDLWIDFVLVDVLHSDRLERSVSDMQRDRGLFDAARPQLVEHRSGEMQSRRRAPQPIPASRA